MKINKIHIISLVIAIVLLSIKFILLKKPDTRLLYTAKKDVFIETVQVSGTYYKTATDTQKAASYATYQNALSNLAVARQNKEMADATMWAKNQAILNAENSVNYKNENIINPVTKKDYTELEKLSIDHSYTQAKKDFIAAENKYKEANISIAAAQAQADVARLDYEDISLEEPLLTVYVNEIYIPKIKIGQKVDIVFDAMKDTVIIGQIKSIDSVGTVTSGIVTFEVKIFIDDLPVGIKPNMTAIATIELINKKNVVTVPQSALIYKNNKTYVQKADNKPGDLTEVKIGEKGYSKAEILSGLNRGVKIVARPNVN
ncbi:hypothetical protein B6D29_03095 [Microgenomates bacterium UTCPR1]|nr:MAG: hypothetical protein B6D29_03095 [Microgenomates bacterium UTCPR1]